MSLVSKVKRLTVADLVESMEVQVSINHQEVARTYKLKIKLKDTEFVSIDDVRDTLESVFLVELEDAIENHIIFCSKVSGIRNLMSSSRSEAGGSSEADEDDSGAGTKGADDDDDADDDYDEGDDLGSDAHKRKQQASDEVDYDEASDDDRGGDELSADMEKGKSDVEDMETSKDEETEHSDNKDEEVMSESKSTSKKGDGKSQRTLLSGKGFSSKKIRRAVNMKSKGLLFEIHFRFTTEPHVLLAQVLSLS